MVAKKAEVPRLTRVTTAHIARQLRTLRSEFADSIHLRESLAVQAADTRRLLGEKEALIRNQRVLVTALLKARQQIRALGAVPTFSLGSADARQG